MKTTKEQRDKMKKVHKCFAEQCGGEVVFGLLDVLDDLDECELIIGLCHNAIGEDEDSDHETLPGVIEKMVREFREGIAWRDATLKRYRDALADQRERWMQLPSGADMDADANDPSPVDASAHTAGLAIRAVDEALATQEAKP